MSSAVVVVAGAATCCSGGLEAAKRPIIARYESDQ